MAGENVTSEKPLGNNITFQEALDRTAALASKGQGILQAFQMQSNIIKICILVISVLTTGSLWVLLTKHFEPVTAWVGAILSTLTMGLAAYQKLDIGPKRNLKEALKLQKEIEELLVRLRTADIFDEKEFFKEYKPLIGAAIRLRYKGRLRSSLTPLELQEIEQSYAQ